MHGPKGSVSEISAYSAIEGSQAKQRKASSDPRQSRIPVNAPTSASIKLVIPSSEPGGRLQVMKAESDHNGFINFQPVNSAQLNPSPGIPGLMTPEMLALEQCSLLDDLSRRKPSMPATKIGASDIKASTGSSAQDRQANHSAPIANKAETAARLAKERDQFAPLQLLQPDLSATINGISQNAPGSTQQRNIADVAPDAGFLFPDSQAYRQNGGGKIPAPTMATDALAQAAREAPLGTEAPASIIQPLPGELLFPSSGSDPEQDSISMAHASAASSTLSGGMLFPDASPGEMPRQSGQEDPFITPLPDIGSPFMADKDPNGHSLSRLPSSEALPIATLEADAAWGFDSTQPRGNNLAATPLSPGEELLFPDPMSSQSNGTPNQSAAAEPPLYQANGAPQRGYNQGTLTTADAQEGYLAGTAGEDAQRSRKSSLEPIAGDILGSTRWNYADNAPVPETRTLPTHYAPENAVDAAGGSDWRPEDGAIPAMTTVTDLSAMQRSDRYDDEASETNDLFIAEDLMSADALAAESLRVGRFAEPIAATGHSRPANPTEGIIVPSAPTADEYVPTRASTETTTPLPQSLLSENPRAEASGRVAATELPPPPTIEMLGPIQEDTPTTNDKGEAGAPLFSRIRWGPKKK